MGDSGVWKIREIRSFGRSEELGDSGDSEISLYVAKIENLFERRRIREIGKFGRLGDTGGSGDREKLFLCGRSVKRRQGGHMGSQRFGKFRAWEIPEIGSFERLGASGDWKIWVYFREIR